MTAPAELSFQQLQEAAAQVPALREALDVAQNNLELLSESYSALELAAEDRGWQRMLTAGEREFTRDGLRQISALCRLHLLKHCLVRRGLLLKSFYVFGGGVEITARADGHEDRAGEQDVNAVVQEFLDDRDNRRALTGASAHQRLENALGTDGNVFVGLWTKPQTGRVQARIVPWDEIEDVISNPQDASEPWYYLRQWRETTVNVNTGMPETRDRKAYYPALNYTPRNRPKSLGPVPVLWDTPIRHVKVNDQQGWRFGVGDAYAALDWARAYREFLEDWAKLVKALSRFAWKSTVPGRKAAAARTRIAAAPSMNATGEPNGAGATALLSPDVTLEAIPKTGATIDSESGRPLATMVAAALGIPVTMLLGDPGVTGARATAETLDQPTELEMGARREIWSELFRDVCEHVIREAVRAPKGKLQGKVDRDEYDREIVVLAGDTDMTVDIQWPDLTDLDTDKMVAAIVAANSTGVIPPEVILRLLAMALGVKHVDELLDKMLDGEGNFEYPEPPPMAGGLGQLAADAARAGVDPANVDGQGQGGEPAKPDPATAEPA